MSGRVLVLDLFPGIGLLARAFEAEGFCVVSGPDRIFGGDVRIFHPPPGVFAGVIGGPPCAAFSRLRHLREATGQVVAENLIPEYERCVAEARPDWFLMENVPEAPVPVIDGYAVHSFVVNNRWYGGEQHRARRFSFGTADGRRLDTSPALVALENQFWSWAVLASTSKNGSIAKSRRQLREEAWARCDAAGKPRRHSPGAYPRRSIARCAELQGLPADFLADSPFTVAGKYAVIGNGVPLPMGRAVAAAVRRAMGYGVASDADRPCYDGP